MHFGICARMFHFENKSTTLRNHFSDMVSYIQFKTEGSTLCMQKEVSVFDSWDSAPGPLFLKRKGLIQTDIVVSAVKLNLPTFTVHMSGTD